MWASGHNGDIKRAAHGFEPTRGCDGGVRQELAQRLGHRHESPSSGKIAPNDDRRWRTPSTASNFRPEASA
jgi:hypothetical protein